MKGDRPNAAKRGPKKAKKAKKAKKRMVGTDKVGQERRKHLRRMAKVERLEAIADQNGNEKLRTTAAKIREKEMRRHARAMARLGVSVDAPEPTPAPAPVSTTPATVTPEEKAPASAGIPRLPNPKEAPKSDPELKPVETGK
jgi:hypothetical protein